MVKKVVCISLLLVLCGIQGVFAQEEGGIHELAGTTAVSWLNLGVGARAAGMGESYTAICNDASAVFWNPANLCRVRNTQVLTQYGMWLAEMSHNAVSFTIPMKKKAKVDTTDTSGTTTASTTNGSTTAGSTGGAYQRYSPFYRPFYSRYTPYSVGYSAQEVKAPPAPPGGTIGVGIGLFDYGTIPGRIDAVTTADDFTANSNCMMISYSNVLGDALGLGITLKMINETIDDISASSFAADAGISLKAGGLQIGVVMQNMGGKLAESDLPQNIRAGIGLSMGALTFSGDYSMPIDHAAKLNAGVEFCFGKAMAIRGGMVAVDDVGGEGMFGLSAGFGLNFGGILMDIAYTPYGSYFGDTIKASMMFGF